MRALAKFLLAVLLLVVLAGVVDLLIGAYAEQRAAEQVSQALGAPASLDIHDWPFTFALVRGVIERVDVHVEEMPLERGAVLRSVDVSLSDVQYGLDDVTDPPEGVPPFDHGEFTATLDDDAVRRLVGVPAGFSLVSLELLQDAVRVAIGPFQVNATVALENGNVVLRPQTPLPFPVRLDIPPLPFGAQVRAVDVEPGLLRVSGVAAP